MIVEGSVIVTIDFHDLEVEDKSFNSIIDALFYDGFNGEITNSSMSIVEEEED